MRIKLKCFLLGVLLLFENTIAGQLPFGAAIPKLPDLSPKPHDDHQESTTQKINQIPKLPDFSLKPHDNSQASSTQKTFLNLPESPSKLKLDDVLGKFGNSSGKIRLEDIPDNTDFDELVKEIIYKGLIEYEEHGSKFPLLDWAVDQLQIPAKLFSNNPVTTSIINIHVCNICSVVMRYFIERSRSGIHRDKLVDVLTFVGTLFHITSERVCRGAIELNIDVLIYVAKENKDLNELKMCATIFQTFSCFKDSRAKWEIHIPDRDTPFNRVNDPSGKTFRILQITDLHLDSFYEQGRTTNCGEPLCCQSDQQLASKPEIAAGKWGDYRECDMPYHSFTNYLEQITQQIKQAGYEIELVYFTGDVINHRVWSTSRESNTKELQKTYGMFKDYFGTIPVYSIIGNHEPHPLNVFSPPSITNELSNRWIYDVLADEWSRWLPNSTAETVHHGGYYTTLIKPGFRIVAINSNVCYTFNWWLLYDDVDPFHQLRWLALILKKAESNNEFVHLLSHVPPGDSTCIQEWTRQFRRIIERFAHIIKAQFNGHTHFDELRVFYNSSNEDQIINVAYNGGSFTSFSDLNPNYRYYTIDAETYDVVDYEQWTYNLDEANLKPDNPPKWYKQYSFKEAYDLNSLKYTEMEELINRMAQNISLLEQYHRFKVRAATPSLTTCKRSCHKDNLCSIVTTEVGDDSKCHSLTRRKGFFSFL